MIALDTHVLVWWLSDKSQLPVKTRRLIDRESRQVSNLCISSISIWEISMLVSRGRLILRVNLEDWITQVEKVTAIAFVLSIIESHSERHNYLNLCTKIHQTE